MSDRWQRIAAETIKVAVILLVCAFWFDARIDESSTQVADAATAEVDRARLETEVRLSELEREQRVTREGIAAAAGQVQAVEAGLREEHQDRLEREREEILSLIESRSVEMRALIEKGLTEIDGAAVAAAAAVHTRVETLASSIQRQPLDMKRRMIYPVVQLRGNGTVGSGVVIRSDPVGEDGVSRTYILTAYHVVHEVMDPEAERKDLVEDLRFLDPENDRLAELPYPAEVISENQEIDLALLRVDLAEPWPYVAELAERDEVRSLQIFDPVYAVGCPLGNKPLPSVGEISSQEKVVSGTNFWMVNAPTFFGNSGGGIFHLPSGRLVGISSMIYTYGKRQPMVVPHMGLFVPLETVRGWLEKEGFGHFFADSAPAAIDSEVAETSAPVSE